MYAGPERRRHWARLAHGRAVLARRLAGVPETVLDVGGGDGFAATIVLSGIRTARYVCLDLDPVARAPEGLPASGGRIRGSATHLSVRANACDLVLCLELLEHLDDPDVATREIARVLRPGGHALIAVPVDSRLWRAVLHGVQWLKRRLGLPARPREHVQIFRRHDVQRLVRLAGLQTIESRACVFSLPVLGPPGTGTATGRLAEALCRRLPLDNFGFVRGRWILSVGRQHLVLLARKP